MKLIIFQMNNITTKGRKDELVQVYCLYSTWQYTQSWAGLEVYIGKKLQPNPELLKIHLCIVVVWAKQFWNYFKQIRDLSKLVNVLIILGVRVLPMEERTYKYEIGAGNNDPCGDSLKLEV